MTPRFHSALVRLGIPLFLLFLVWGCKKGTLLENQPPETYTSIRSINLYGEDRLNSVITLQWWGTDPDGTVAGYELTFDQTIWTYTEEQDSTFQFSINAGSDTIDIDLWIRAIDNDGDADETPAYLRIPLKNTPPEVAFNTDLLPTDTAFNVLTLSWEASDLDGIETIESIQIKANDGPWTSLSPNLSVATIVPDDPEASGATACTFYSDVDETGPAIEGIALNDLNSIYIRAIDIAGSESVEDTLANIYLRGKTNDILVAGAHDKCPASFYPDQLSTAGKSVDFIDLDRASAKNQPGIWNPTFTLILMQYEAVVIYASDVKYLNAQTSEDNQLAELASSSIQYYVDNGGKLLVSSPFANDIEPTSALFGILPVDSLSSSEGFARLPTDSMAIGLETGYPNLVSGEFITLDPIYPSSDAIPIYSAQLTPVNNWTGPTTVGVKRTLDGNTNFIFTSLELHRVDQDPSAVEAFFDHVFNTEFAW